MVSFRVSPVLVLVSCQSISSSTLHNSYPVSPQGIGTSPLSFDLGPVLSRGV